MPDKNIASGEQFSIVSRRVTTRKSESPGRCPLAMQYAGRKRPKCFGHPSGIGMRRPRPDMVLGWNPLAVAAPAQTGPVMELNNRFGFYKLLRKIH